MYKVIAHLRKKEDEDNRTTDGWVLNPATRMNVTKMTLEEVLDAFLKRGCLIFESKNGEILIVQKYRLITSEAVHNSPL